jgi:hypothetical protein
VHKRPPYRNLTPSSQNLYDNNILGINQSIARSGFYGPTRNINKVLAGDDANFSDTSRGSGGIDPDASVFCGILIRVSVVRSLLLLPRRCPKMGYSALFQRDDVYA